MSNAWVDRFEVDISDAELRRRIRAPVVPLLGLDKDPIDVAVLRLESTLKAIFIPTVQTCTILRLMLCRARAYAQLQYPGQLEYVRGMYAADVPSTSQFPFATCLTGLGGAGKSSLLSAFARIVPRNAEMEIPHHGIVQLQTHLYVSIDSSSTLRSVLHSVTNPRRGFQCEKPAQRQIFSRGISLTLLDELQFLSASDSANAAVSKMLMRMHSLGPPLFYAANFSLVHRLTRRPQEETQRLLSAVLVMEPDAEGSSDWVATLDEQLHAAPEFGDLDAKKHGSQIYGYTFGLKRLVALLLIIAYKISRELHATKITITHIERAYRHADYAMARRDVELLWQHVRGERNLEESNRLDLWCPVSGRPAKEDVVVPHPAKNEHDRRVAEAAVLSSLSQDAQKTYRSLRAPTASAEQKQLSARMIGRPPMSVGSLLAGADAFEQKLAKKGRRALNK